MTTGLDQLRGAIERRFPAVAAMLVRGDGTPERTHINHALVIILLFGSIGAGVGFWVTMPALGFRVGLVVGWLAYVVREVSQRWGPSFTANGWDGCCDVLIPAWIVSAAVLPGSLAVFWSLTAIVAALYFPLRPKDRA